MIVWQDPPPYVQYMAEAEALGRAVYLGGFCTGLGIVVSDPVAMQDLADDFMRRSVIARTDGPVVDEAFRQGIERERTAVDLMMDFGPDDGSERRQRREDQASDYIGNGCAELTIDYPSAFSIAPDDRDQAEAE